MPAANPTKGFRVTSLIDVWSPMKLIRNDRVLGLAVLGNMYFFFVAALLQFNIFLYGQDVLHLDATHGGMLQAAVAIGIGVGSLAAGFLSGGKIEYGLIPLGSLGMTAFGLCLAIRGLSFEAVLGLLASLGFAGGFFIVPVSALIQHLPGEESKGGVLGAANWLSFVGVGVASGAYYGASHWTHLNPGANFLVGIAGYAGRDGLRLVLAAGRNAAPAAVACHAHAVPAGHRRARASSREGRRAARPQSRLHGGCGFLIASLDRPIRFLMFKGSYEHPVGQAFRENTWV